MAVAGIGREHTPLSGDGSERIHIKSGTVENTRAAAHPHISAFDAAGDTQADRAPDIPLPQAGALHAPPDHSPGGDRPAYDPATAADAHVPSAHTYSAGAAALRDHDTTDADRLGAAPEAVDIDASP
ncbi:hypothetical protein [Streptomyces sp. MBT33]|uniref:hypothetical protein n=1 Tax=Streptomyces sp. MBT33 TaxID=1488363 RepID=UPI00190B281B|nr:hypothetical protein [Streptomyces sp. MBT33]MBK3640863.1 hypothetical protein [Streptomyces sp. MBT33]